MALGDADLNLLVALDALLSERNVTRAGQRIGLSQPTASRALARLRRMFDDPLLVKVGREMQLTPRAELLAPQVREILRLTDRALHQSTDFDPATSSLELSVSCSDYVTLVLMSHVVSRLREDAPRAALHLLPRRADNHMLLRRGDVDLVIEPRALMRAEGLSSQAIFTDVWRVAVWSGSPLARGPIDRDRFAAAPYLTYTLGTTRIANLADQILDRQGLRREPTVTTENFSLVPFLLRGTDLVSLVLEQGVLAFGDGIEIALRDEPFDLPLLVEAMYWNPRNDGDPAHSWLRATIADVATRL